MLKFGETRFESDARGLRLCTLDGRVILELEGHEVEAAVRAGFLDPADWHYSLFEYARMRDLPGVVESESQVVERFLRSMKEPGDAAA